MGEASSIAHNLTLPRMNSLSLCMYLLMVQAWNKSLRDEQKVYDQLPIEAQRHFIVVREENNV